MDGCARLRAPRWMRVQIVDPRGESLRRTEPTSPRRCPEPLRLFKAKKLACSSSGVRWCSRLLNRIVRSRCGRRARPAVRRVTGISGRCVRSRSDGSAFSLVSSLSPRTPQIPGAPGSFSARPLLRYYGTVFDPRKRACWTCGAAPSPTDPLQCAKRMLPGSPASVRKVSNCVLVVPDSVGETSNPAMIARHHCCLPCDGSGRPPQKNVFGVQYTARLCLCERFRAGGSARRHASLEAEATG